jgi:predicted AlkP superfamily pyrophosphatase or phosphodiesterase
LIYSKAITVKNLLYCFAFLAATGTFAQKASHVVLITIDGFRPDFYLEQGWAAPNLQQMKTEGAYANGVRGVMPTVTYPSHTTIVSGVMPIKHGIFYNTPFEPAGQTGRWYWEYDSIKVPTIWTAAKAKGLTTACISWPVTVHAPITYSVPEVWKLKPGSSEKGRLEALYENETPKGLLNELQQQATGQLTDADLSGDYLALDENNARMAGYLLRKYKPAFTAVHLPCVDHFEHAAGRSGDKARLAVAGADRAVKTILESIEKAGLKDSTVVIVTGDHGFVDIHTAVSPNIWLQQAGLITNVKAGNWKARFLASGGSAFLHLKNRNDQQTLQQVITLLQNLPAGHKKLFRILDRRQLDSIGADPNVPLVLAAIQGISFNNSEKGEVLKAAKGGTHGYYPDFREIQTGFIAIGPGIRPGAVIPEMGLEDIAPLVSRILGLDMQTDGAIYPGMFASQKAAIGASQ